MEYESVAGLPAPIGLLPWREKAHNANAVMKREQSTDMKKALVALFQGASQQDQSKFKKFFRFEIQ